MLDTKKTDYLYEQLYYHLKQKIERGTLPPGEQLPSERELAASYGISRFTVRKAVGLLVQEGYIDAYQGSGSFVASTPP